MNNEEFLNSLKLLGIEVTNKELSKFEKYKDLLKEYNQKFNLTSITNDLDIYLKHFYDSLCLFKIKEVKENKTLLDIGTGASRHSLSNNKFKFKSVLIRIKHKKM